MNTWGQLNPQTQAAVSTSLVGGCARFFQTRLLLGFGLDPSTVYSEVAESREKNFSGSQPDEGVAFPGVSAAVWHVARLCLGGRSTGEIGRKIRDQEI